MSIEAGSVVEGVVSGITNFGAFVDLPDGKTGLIHISEVADVYVSDVHDFLKEKDKVKVKVLSVDDRGKVALSIKQLPKSADTDSSSTKAMPPRNNFPPRGMDVRRRPLSASFEDKLSKFMKDSDERQVDLRRKTDSKRGGRGSRRG